MSGDVQEQFGGVWGEHPRYPVADWKYEVANDDTRHSYWYWVHSHIAQEKETQEAEDEGSTGT